jgi:hypothetical protein
VERIGQHVEEVLKTIIDSTQEGENSKPKEKIENIRQAMENYRSRIIDFTTLLAPRTPHQKLEHKWCRR